MFAARAIARGGMALHPRRHHTGGPEPPQGWSSTLRAAPPLLEWGEGDRTAVVIGECHTLRPMRSPTQTCYARLQGPM